MIERKQEGKEKTHRLMQRKAKRDKHIKKRYGQKEKEKKNFSGTN